MDYHLAADILSKFQSSPAWIQALWLLLTAAIPIAPFVSFLVALRLWPRRPPLEPPREPAPPPRLLGEILYGVVRAPDGRWFAP